MSRVERVNPPDSWWHRRRRRIGFAALFELHQEARQGELSSAIGSGKGIDELDESAKKAAEALFTLR